VFIPPPELVVWETPHWRVNQRCDAVLPGYLMIGAKDPEGQDFASLSSAALAELGPVLQRTQNAVREILQPVHLYLSRWGHDAGHTVHFHLIPVCDWVVAAYEADARYRQLHDFYTRPPTTAAEFDGPDMALFICREFAEGKTPPAIVGPSVAEVVTRLRQVLAAS